MDILGKFVEVLDNKRKEVKEVDSAIRSDVEKACAQFEDAVDKYAKLFEGKEGEAQLKKLKEIYRNEVIRTCTVNYKNIKGLTDFQSSIVEKLQTKQVKELTPEKIQVKLANALDAISEKLKGNSISNS